MDLNGMEREACTTGGGRGEGGEGREVCRFNRDSKCHKGKF